MCAMAFSRPPAELTTVDQCSLCDLDPKVPLADRALCFEERIDPPPPEDVPLGMPVSPLDTRCLSMRLQRVHLQDCFTSETNVVLQGCVKHMNTTVCSTSSLPHITQRTTPSDQRPETHETKLNPTL